MIVREKVDKLFEENREKSLGYLPQAQSRMKKCVMNEFFDLPIRYFIKDFFFKNNNFDLVSYEN